MYKRKLAVSGADVAFFFLHELNCSYNLNLVSHDHGEQAGASAELLPLCHTHILAFFDVSILYNHPCILFSQQLPNISASCCLFLKSPEETMVRFLASPAVYDSSIVH